MAGVDSLSPSMEFAFLVVGVFVFFGIHNFLQEAIMHLPNFKFGSILGYTEVLGVFTCCHIERRLKNELERKASLKSYLALTMCLMGSSLMSNIALNYINFPVKVVFRSCKLVPTMLISRIIHGKTFSVGEYMSGICVCLGLILFGWADFDASPNFHLGGILLVTASVLCDALLPNLQQAVFEGTGASRLEVTYWTNALCLGAMSATLGASGDLAGAAGYLAGSPRACLCVAAYTAVAYAAIGCHMNVVQRFGGVTATFVGNSRKAMTIVLSFFFFPKPFTLAYGCGAALVFGGVILNVLVKDRQKKAAAATKQQLSPSPPEETKHTYGKKWEDDGGESGTSLTQLETSRQDFMNSTGGGEAHLRKAHQHTH